MDRVVKRGERPELKMKWPVGFRDLLDRCWHRDKNERPSFSAVVKSLDGECEIYVILKRYFL